MTPRGVGRARLDPGSTDRFTSLRRPLGVTSLGLNQLTLAPRQQGRIHRHEHQEEVYLVLEGNLTVEVEGEAIELEAGELLRVAPPLRRRLSNRGEATVRALAIGGSGHHESRDGVAFTSWEQRTGAPPQEVPLPEDLEP